MESLGLLNSSVFLPKANPALNSRSPKPSFSLRNSLKSNFFSSNLVPKPHSPKQSRHPSNQLTVKAGLIGENPEWFDDDFVVVGLAHCFLKKDNKLTDYFVIEPITAASFECMHNGGATSFKCAMGSTLGLLLKQDKSALPPEFSSGIFGEKFDFRAKAASRTWKRAHPQEHLLKLAPIGVVKTDYNFSLESKRVLNERYEVKDGDNVKQDMSIDVYGRKDEGKEGQEKKKDDDNSLIAALYNA